MQFEALKVFCDVARHRSFSQAATANARTQSAVSQIVHQLEKRLVVRLVDRSTRPLQLTEAGKVFFEGCKRLVQQYAELEASVRDSQAQMESVLQVAAIYSVGLGDMGQFAERFMAQEPTVKVQLEYLHPDRVYESVLEGTADFGLVSFPRKSRELAVLPWRDEEMMVVCAPGHPLARYSSVRPALLDGERFVGFAKDLVVRREVDRFLRDEGVAVQMVMEFDNVENIKKAIEIGAGVALLPEPTLRHEIEAGTLAARPLLGASLVRPLGIIHRRHQRLSSTAQRFIALLQDGTEAAHHNGPVGAGSNGATALPRSAAAHRSRNGKSHTVKRA